MIRHDGMVKLLDFGVAQVADRDADSRSDTVKGKFAYMAPEQAQQKSIDGRADVFALGVCLYEMLTGARLYKRGTLRETIEALLLEPVPSLRASQPTLPAELDDILRLALAKDPSDRFASAADMQAALETFLARSGEVVSARRISSMMDAIYPEARVGSPSLFTGPEVAERLAALEDDAEAQGIAPSGTPTDLTFLNRGSLRLVFTVALGLLLCGIVWLWAVREPIASVSSGSAARSAEPTAAPAPPSAASREAAPGVTPTPTASPAAAPVVPTSGALTGEPAPGKRGNAPARRRRRSPDFVATPGF
jgi:serine/threonine-protein kinase